MRRPDFFILITALCLLIFLLIPATADSAGYDPDSGVTHVLRPVKVAVYEYPPFINLREDKTPSGFFIDVLEDIARKEGWSVTYVPGSWQECLDRTTTGEVDFIGLITHTKDRESSFEFSNETFFVTWGQLYTLRGSGIGDLPSLSEKKIAVLKGDIYYLLFSSYVSSFEINCSYIEANTYSDVFSLVENGAADAGLVDRVYGLLDYREDIFAPGAIVCCPIHLVMATPAGKEQGLLAAFDRDLAELKKDQSSVYYTSLDYWFGNLPEKEVIPAWIWWVTGGIIAVLILAWAANMLLSRQVQHRTRELRDEIEEHRQSEQALASEKVKLKSILDAMPYGVFMVDRDFAIQYINPALESEFGPVTGKKCYEYLFSGSSPCPWCRNEQVFSGQSFKWEWTSAKTKKDYLLFDIPVRNPDGSIYKLEIFQDITGMKKAQESQNRLNRALTAVNRANEILVREKDEQQLLDAVCSVIVEMGGYHAAWVAYRGGMDRNPDTGFTLVSSAGMTADMHAWLEQKVSGDQFQDHSTTSAALQEGSVLIYNDISNSPEFRYFPELAGLWEIRSILVVPLRTSREDIGALTLYGRDPDTFTTAETDLLSRLADDLSFGVMAIRNEHEREKAVASLAENEKKFRELFDNANDPIFLHAITGEGRPGQFIEVNMKACERYGYTHDEFLSMTVLDINDPKYPGDPASIMALYSTGSHNTFEWAHMTKHGSGFPVEISTHRFTMGGTDVALSIVRDITERKRFEEERKVAYTKIEENMREMAILNDEIRNPLSVIIAVVDMLNSADGELVKRQVKIIDSIINKLDLGFLESEKVRSFLQRYSRFDDYEGNKEK